MDPYINPFTPGAGITPPELAGRQEVLEKARTSFRRAVAGKNARHMLLLGLRGTGKTALLNAIERIGCEEELLVTRFEASEDKTFVEMLTVDIRKVLRSLSTIGVARDLATQGLGVLKSFASTVTKLSAFGASIEVNPVLGEADSGYLEKDLPDIFAAVGRAAAAAGKGWVLLIDEVQYLAAADLSALIGALHRMNQIQTPVVCVSAGLPQVAKLAGDAKSYAERLFACTEIGALDRVDARQAILRPIEDEGASIDAAALDAIVDGAHGYPFYLQAWGSEVWDQAAGPSIDLNDALNARHRTREMLDNGFFRVRTDRLTPAEMTFVTAMADLGDGPYPIAEVAAKLGKSLGSLGPTRAGAINKGMIYSSGHGVLDFTVPLFADHLRRCVASTREN
ncbi:MAG: ATP-binding protein [Rhodobacteraceae bacterium]|nr:ATP-binding protein [Paracoccaceae bacterium]MCY4197906.1 ATP-binding protein [Paracoccaceae bacterium]MCY4326110.1 ATP-binding protein [Paracoccaceae bacterium]